MGQAKGTVLKAGSIGVGAGRLLRERSGGVRSFDGMKSAAVD